MKGLLLKDFYMLTKYCKANFIMSLIFIVISCFGDNLFLVSYPCISVAMIPISLFSYDENSKWVEYCGCFPYKKSEIVSNKYLIGIFVQFVNITVIAITQSIKMKVLKEFDISTLLELVGFLIIFSSFFTSLAMPFIFKFGVEKGRLGYSFMVGALCAISAILGMNKTLIPTGDILVLIFIVSILIFAASWLLSIKIYEKKEL